MASCVVQFTQKQALKKPMIVLFDSGSSHTWVSNSALPKGSVPLKGEPATSSALAGPMSSNLSVTMERLVFPEFFKTRIVDKANARVFHTECRYDAIIGRDLLQELGMVLDFKHTKMTWDDCSVPMRSYPSSASRLPKDSKVSKADLPKEPSAAEQLYLDAIEQDLDDNDTLPTCDLTDDEDDDYFLDDDLYGTEEGNDQAVDENNKGRVAWFG